MEVLNTKNFDKAVLDDATRGYIAGLIDGEGCISRQIRHSGKVQPILTITNGHIPILQFCQKAIGGTIRQSHNQSRITSREKTYISRPCYRLDIGAQDEILNVLEQVKDLLILKKEKALWAIEIVSGRKKEYVELPHHLLDSRPK